MADSGLVGGAKGCHKALMAEQHSRGPKNAKPEKGPKPAAKPPAHAAVVVKDLVDLGRDALMRGDLDAALRAVNGASSRAPHDREVLRLKAALLAAEGDHEAALEVLETAAGRYRHDVNIVMDQIAILLDDIGDAEEALPLIRDCLSRLSEGDDDDDDRRARRAELMLRAVDAHLALGNVDDAVRVAEDAVAAAGDDDVGGAFARAALARAVLAGGDVDAALVHAEAAAEGCRDSADIFVVVGRVKSVKGDDAGASAAFARARELDDDAPLPPRLSASDFAARVASVCAALPQPMKGYIKKLTFTHILHSDVERLKKLERSPETPMLLDGPVRDSGGTDPFKHLPTDVVIYQRNLESLVGEADELDDAIAAVVVESIGMFLGLDFEEDLKTFVDLYAD